MLDPITAVAGAAVILTIVSMVISRVIPDRYDNLELSKAPARRR